MKINKTVIILCIVLVLLTVGGVIGYFAYRSYQKTFTKIDSEYPVAYKTNKKTGTITISLDGSETKDLKWDCNIENEEVVGIKQKGKESGGKAKYIISPKAAGLTNVTFSRNDETSGVSYSVAKVSLPIYVTEDNGKLMVTFLDKPKIIVGSTAYADDTDYPFLLDYNENGIPQITFPQGQSDWFIKDEKGIVTASNSTGAGGDVYVIVQSTASSTDATPVYDRQETTLNVSSASLGKSYTFDVTVEVDGTIKVEDESK